MKIILLKDVKGVGKRFEEKEVTNGYASNFLLPRNLALLRDKAGTAKVKQLEEQSQTKRAEGIEKIEEKQARREAKRLELEKFKREQQT